ncbi:helix-turn-helix domain-containing protein [Paenibacillus sp. LHD-117]|uniref:helix-turn-helix domain-containing protein n=1 Tax=Paenibacillus sp. LHD-117 TaxID=3071412 RepID=UPI0027E14CBA|nr:RodZ domain-containing protein [Paenibacillus sp. LHD-117]MDQ6419188.1 helix-turn-helix domain-containing protein [Paenibacillus sp. LHD-117]
MSELGALLRRAREERGLSLDDIQELTKIRKRYLEAIESGDYSVLPGTFYVRAFVKNYSEAVGLEPDEVLRLYQHEIPASPVEQTVEPIPARKPRRVKSQTSERFGKIGFNLVMWCFLILIVVVVWYYAFNKDSGGADSVDESPITENSEPPKETSAGSATESPVASPTPPPPTQAPTTVTFNSKVGRADQYDIGPAGVPHKVEIKISGGRNWIEVREGGATGKKLFYANAEDGAVQNYELTGTLYITVGRSDLAEIKVDGVLVPDSDRANAKRLLLKPLAEGARGESNTSNVGEGAGTGTNTTGEDSMTSE